MQAGRGHPSWSSNGVRTEHTRGYPTLGWAGSGMGVGWRWRWRWNGGKSVVHVMGGLGMAEIYGMEKERIECRAESRFQTIILGRLRW